jgi:hypothetical protein
MIASRALSQAKRGLYNQSNYLTRVMPLLKPAIRLNGRVRKVMLKNR